MSPAPSGAVPQQSGAVCPMVMPCIPGAPTCEACLSAAPVILDLRSAQTPREVDLMRRCLNAETYAREAHAELAKAKNRIVALESRTALPRTVSL